MGSRGEKGSAGEGVQDILDTLLNLVIIFCSEKFTKFRLPPLRTPLPLLRFPKRAGSRCCIIDIREGRVPVESRFAEILEQADGLPLGDQIELVELLQSRVRDRRRTELAEDAAEAQKEFERGDCRPATAQDLVREILS